MTKNLPDGVTVSHVGDGLYLLSSPVPAKVIWESKDGFKIIDIPDGVELQKPKTLDTVWSEQK